jgi:eukaryotic-like serine/threonine-protein kinase
VDATGDRLDARAPTDSSDTALRGRQLGDFILRECIGEGAFAAVYRCDQPLLGREAVVKVLHQRLRGSEVVFQRFMREARLASRLDHPYAAHVYAFGVEPDDGLAWIAMELVHGTSLARWLTERGPLSLDVLVAFFEQVAEIVQNAHDHGIVHRDLKPSNVMIIEYAGKIFPKLLDFGIAKLVDEAVQAGLPIAPELLPLASGPIAIDDTLVSAPPDSGNLQLTQANATLGSPPYMSPEQWCDPLSVGPRSDLYSLGIMAYEALTGQQPFTGPTIAAIGEQHCNAEVPPVGDEFPPALDRVFRRALAKSPDDRPASALAFAHELRAAASTRSTDPDAAAVDAMLLSRRRSSLILAGIAVASLGAFFGHRMLRNSERAALQATTAAAATTPAAPAAIPPAKPTPAAPEPPAPPPAPAMVTVRIESQPIGADVFRIPSDTRVGATPYSAELLQQDGTQIFLIRKPGFADRTVEIDLRTGGTRAIRLARAIHRLPPVPAQRPSAPPPPAPRREGEPVDPFRPGGT